MKWLRALWNLLLLTDRVERLESEMQDEVSKLNRLTSIVTQHNADAVAYQESVNGKIKALEDQITQGENPALDQAFSDLTTAINNQPVLTLPA